MDCDCDCDCVTEPRWPLGGVDEFFWTTSISSFSWMKKSHPGTASIFLRIKLKIRKTRGTLPQHLIPELLPTFQHPNSCKTLLQQKLLKGGRWVNFLYLQEVGYTPRMSYTFSYLIIITIRIIMNELCDRHCFPPLHLFTNAWLILKFHLMFKCKFYRNAASHLLIFCFPISVSISLHIHRLLSINQIYFCHSKTFINILMRSIAQQWIRRTQFKFPWSSTQMAIVTIPSKRKLTCTHLVTQRFSIGSSIYHRYSEGKNVWSFFLCGPCSTCITKRSITTCWHDYWNAITAGP